MADNIAVRQVSLQDLTTAIAAPAGMKDIQYVNGSLVQVNPDGTTSPLGGGNNPDLTVSVTGAPAPRLDVTLVPADSRYDRIRLDGTIIVDSGMVGNRNIKWQVNGADPPSNVVKNNWVNNLTATAITVQTGADTIIGTGDPGRRIQINGYIYMAQTGYKVAMITWTSEQITTDPFRNAGIQVWKEAATAITQWSLVDSVGGNVFGVGSKINFWLEG